MRSAVKHRVVVPRWGLVQWDWAGSVWGCPRRRQGAVRRTTRSSFKTVLWTSLGLTALFVFITSEALLVTDYPMYHAYRLQVIVDRHLLIPHTLCGIIALLAGPLQFSSRLRQRHLKIPSRPWPHLCYLRIHRCLDWNRALRRPTRHAGNLPAGRRLDRLHRRRLHNRA